LNAGWQTAETREMPPKEAGETFGYSALGADEFPQPLILFGCSCLQVKYDQYPEKPVSLIAQKI